MFQMWEHQTFQDDLCDFVIFAHHDPYAYGKVSKKQSFFGFCALNHFEFSSGHLIRVVAYLDIHA